jgi:hypothetical protein
MGAFFMTTCEIPVSRTADMLRRLAVSLQDSPDIVYFVDRDLYLVAFNRAWDRFALANDGEDCAGAKYLGRNLEEVIPEPLREFYRNGFRQAGESGKPWMHEFECPSPAAFRRFLMRVLPVSDHAGFAIVNTLVREYPHRGGTTREEAVYTGPEGIVTVCCHCRRTKRADGSELWDWVPGYVADPPAKSSHGLCGVCFAYFYPSLLPRLPLP